MRTRPLLATLVLCACASAPVPAEPRPTVAGSFVVATYNLEHESWADAETLETVGRTQADVILLQEVSTEWQAVLERRYSADYAHASFHAARGTSGLGILSRYPLSDAERIEPVARHPASRARVYVPGGPVEVLNVHLRASARRGQNPLWGVLTMSSDHRLEIESFLASCPRPPTLVAGDMNEGPRGAAVRWLEERGYASALPRYRPRQPTWRFAAGLLSAAYDHVLFGKRLRVLDAWVVESGASDHFPVVARFAVDARCVDGSCTSAH